MVQRQGLRYAFDTFRQVHLFDIRNGVTTAPIFPLSSYEATSRNLEFAFQYQASWTSTTRSLFYLAKSKLQDEMDEYAFIDVGSGMGKVALVWQQELHRLKLEQPIILVELEESLLRMAERNMDRMFPGCETSYLLSDVLDVDFRQFNRKLILFLQNPFTPPVMIELASRLANLEHILLLANPTLSTTIQDCGYTEVQKTESYHQLGRGAIFVPSV